MTFERKRLVGIGAAILVAVAGGGAAIAASGHHGSANANRPGGFPGSGPGPGGPPPGYGFRGGGPGPGGDLQTASSYLGISVETLRSDLRSGKTLAQVADATAGKDTAGLVAALFAAGKRHLEQEVSAGRLTRTQADQLASGLQARVQAQVDGSLGGRDHGFGPPEGDRHGFGPGGGRGGSTPTTTAPTTTVPPTHI
jgi:hypothetical protein